MFLDHTDRKIIGILQDDGRISMKKLAAEISMSVPSTIERVRKLEEQGIIEGYRAVVNAEKLGKPIAAYILVSISTETRPEFYHFVAKNEDVAECYEITGRFQAIVRVNCSDMTKFLEIVNRIYSWGGSETYVLTRNLGELKGFDGRRM